jgi:glycosyltransferase involved in cell wall biosynthesis
MSRLSVLLVSHAPLAPELGVARAHLALREHLLAAGHAVEVFDVTSAFPDGQSRFARRLPGRFADKAAAFVRREGRRFDVIDAQHGDLPFTDAELGFDGVLVARSQGLYAFYAEYLRLERERWPHLLPGTKAGRALARWKLRAQEADCRRSLETADLVFVMNEEEQRHVRERLGVRKSVVLPNGLGDDEAHALAASQRQTAERSIRKEIVFIGSWSLRKGRADWAEIIGRTRARVADARFSFIGTGVAERVVLDDLGLTPQTWIRAIPSFGRSELPSLLAGAAVSALPSYVEGCPLGVLESLACGLPVVAYDIPGARALLGGLDTSLVVPLGDVEAFAGRLAELLVLRDADRDRLSKNCIQVCTRFRWAEINQATLDAYDQALRRTGVAA